MEAGKTQGKSLDLVDTKIELPQFGQVPYCVRKLREIREVTAEVEGLEVLQLSN